MAACMVAVMVCLATAEPAVAQQRVITGTVVAARTLQPLAGASVQAVEVGRGAVTDVSGRFRIEGVPGDPFTLRVSRLGYRPVDRRVEPAETAVQISLEESAIDLDELVVTGTPGGVQRRALGNALARLDADRITETAPVANVSQLMNARAPGVVLQEQAGIAGGGARILIRGRGSMQFVGDPLIYVDGVRVNNRLASGPTHGAAGSSPSALSRLDDISPQDIESIEVIKGPAAATLYGTEASGGVIQIITKRGRPGDHSMGVRIRQGGSWLANEKRKVGTAWGRRPDTGEVFEFDPLQAMRARGAELFQTGHTQGYGVDVRGGVESVQYFASVNYDREEGIVPSNVARRFSGRANLNFQPLQTLDVGASFSVATGRTDSYSGSYFYSARFPSPHLLNTIGGGFTGVPPDVQVATEEIYQDLNRYTAGVELRHNPRQWLSQRLSVGLDVTNTDDVVLIPFVPAAYAEFFSPTGRLGSKSIGTNQTGLYTVDYSGTVRLPLTARVQSATSGGFQFYHRLMATKLVAGQQFPAPGVTTIAGIAGPRQASEDYLENRTIGLYLQQQFEIDGRLFITGALRADDNTAFGANFDWVFYPKLSASWVVSEERFWNLHFIDAFRLRAAYGESGQQPDAFAAIRMYSPAVGRGDNPAATPTFAGNPDLGPERGKEVELGFEAGLLGDRIGVDFTTYFQRTTDAIVARDVAPSTGFPARQFVNAGEVRNRGVEVLLTVRPIESDDVQWDLSFNYSRNRNRVGSLDIPGVDWLGVGFIPNRHQPGYPVASYFGRRIASAELDADGRATNVLCDDGQGGAVPCPQAPALFLGSNVPHTEGSASSAVTLFGRWQVAAMVDFKLGRHYFSSDRAIRCRGFQVHHINFFPQDYDPIEVAYCQDPVGTGPFSAGFIRRADFARLREVSLNYRLPDRWASSFGARRASITVAARNLHTWSERGPWAPPDPEIFTPVNYGSSNHLQAIVPIPTQFMTTFNLTF